ncbi:MAG TPA: TadE/TadG family type IV pilus assembly protein [Candidatus Limnocylindria bacterium]|nr:TadE/TadG family type IV pilus assembly protein [Candidatus Limnocylindria bacterium]
MHRLRSFHQADEGQNLVEFALLLPILMYILMGIMQFGLIFAVYLTLNNAVREGARWASIYVYDNSSSQATNDAARNDGLLDRVVDAKGILAMNRTSNTTNFSASTTWTSGTSASGAGAACLVPTGTTLETWYANGDTLVCYDYTTADGTNTTRKGYFMYVESYYHLQVFMPLLQPFLPDDPTKSGATGAWIRLPGRITVVIN